MRTKRAHHREWTPRLSEYLSDELSEADRLAVEAHLAVCDECTDALRGLARSRIVPAAHVRILSLAERAAKRVFLTGVAGLLEVRTPATARGEGDGWVTTNDLASLDSDGFLYIHGRADEAIVRGGFKVIPREIEELLESHPEVTAAAVYGRPDARLGAVPVAAE